MNEKLVHGALVTIESTNKLNNSERSTVYIRDTCDFTTNGHWVSDGKIWLVLSRNDTAVRLISSCGKYCGWVEECYYTSQNTRVIDEL